MQQNELSLQEIVNLFDYESVQSFIDKELEDQGFSANLPKPALPQVLENASAYGAPLVDMSTGEPMINPAIDFDQLDLGILRSLYWFVTNWTGYESNEVMKLEIAVDCLKIQKKKCEAGTAVLSRENGQAAATIKYFQELDTAANLIGNALIIKEGQLKILKNRYDFHRRLLNTLSRGATIESNMNEYTRSSESSGKWSYNKGGNSGGFGRIR